MSGHSAASAFSRPGAPSTTDQLRRSQSAPDEIVEQRASRLDFAAHGLDRQQNFLAVRPHAKRDKQQTEVAFLSSRTRATVPSRINRTIGSSASERAFQASQSPFTLRQVRLTTSLPTGPAKTALNARRTRRVLIPAISPGDQGVGCPGAALVGARRTAPPFARLSISAGQPSARHGDPRLDKRARQRPLAMPVAHADNRRHRLVLPRSAPAVAPTLQRLAEFRLQHHLDETAHPSPDPVLDRVEPIIEKQSLGGIPTTSATGPPPLDPTVSVPAQRAPESPVPNASAARLSWSPAVALGPGFFSRSPLWPGMAGISGRRIGLDSQWP